MLWQETVIVPATTPETVALLVERHARNQDKVYLARVGFRLWFGNAELTPFHQVITTIGAGIHHLLVGDRKEKRLLVLVFLHECQQTDFIMNRVIQQHGLCLLEARLLLQPLHHTGRRFLHLLLSKHTAFLIQQLTHLRLLSANTIVRKQLQQITDVSLKKHIYHGKTTQNYCFICISAKMALTLYEFSDMKRLLYIMPLLLLLLASCQEKTTETTSSYAEITAFTFATDTANPGLTAATYKVEQRTDTGYIYNKDSLTFGTRLDSVLPRFTYKATPASVTIVLPDTSIVATGADTVDFSREPIFVHVKSSDLTNEKWYQLMFTVHQVDPDLYVWTRLTERIFTRTCDMQAFYIDGQLVLFTNDGISTEIYTSSDGSVWAKGNVAGLPANCRVRNILQLGSTLYYADGDYLYTSTDITTWTASDYSSRAYSFVNMLVAFDNKAWCILRDSSTDQLLLGCTQHDSILPSQPVYGLQGNSNILPEDFPVSDFAALSFAASSERPRAMIIGGRTEDGTPLNTRWNLEYEASAGYRIKNFSIEQPDFHSLTGVSVIQYDNHLVMFGGIDNDLTWRTSMLFSDDEGMNWYAPDTTHNRLPDTYGQRQKQAAVVDAHNNIYLIGGQSFTETFSDVYRGYLTSIDW